MDSDVTVFGVFGANVTEPAFWMGAAVVAVLAFGRFANETPMISYFSPPIPNRFHTTWFRYYLAAIIYVMFVGALYAAAVFAQSFPQVIDKLGPILGPAEDLMEERTGAGAAIVGVTLTAFVLPALRPIASFDQRLRTALHEFASIPDKAWIFANEIVEGVDTLAYERDPSLMGLPATFLERSGGDEDRWSDPRVYLALRRKIDLLSSPGSKHNRKYRRLFTSYRPVIARFDAVYRALHGAESPGANARTYYRREMTELVEQVALLIACAVLRVEVDEYRAARFMRERLHIADIAVPNFRFVPSQIVSASIIIFASSVVGMGLASAIVQYTGLQGSPIDIAESLIRGAPLVVGEDDINDVLEVSGNMGRFAMQWAAVTIPLYLLPLTLAIGMQLYVTDRQSAGTGGDGRERLLAVAGTLIFGFILASIPLLFAATLVKPEGVAPSDDVNLALILPWAIAPAFFAATFVLLSNARPTPSRHLNFVLDFVILGVVTGVASAWATDYCFANLEQPFVELRAQIAAGALDPEAGRAQIAALQHQFLHNNPLADMRKGFVQLAFPLAATFLAGTLGSLVLYRSRSYPNRRRKPRAAVEAAPQPTR